MSAAFGGRHRMDLIDDDGFYIRQRFSRRRGQHQIEAFGRRDQQISRMANQLGPIFVLVSPVLRNSRRTECNPEPLCRQFDAFDRSPQVLLDIERQRSQRADVQNAGPLLRLGHGRGPEPIDSPQKRGQGLSSTSRSKHQRVATRNDRRPTKPLGRSRLGEARFEPRLDRRREEVKHDHTLENEMARGDSARTE